MKDYNEIATNVLRRRDEYITEHNKRIKRTVAVLSCFVIVALAGFGIWKAGVLEKSPVSSGNPVPLPLSLSAYALLESEYPDAAVYPDYNTMGDEEFQNAMTEWRRQNAEKKDTYEKNAPDLNDFFVSTIRGFLTGSETENQVYSPVNVYMALAMLSEITDGNGRQQILELLGTESIENLRKESSAVWNAHYSDDGRFTSILSASLWLNESVGFNESLINTLADNYYVSVYRGDTADSKFTKLLQTWLDEQTRGTLSEEVKKVELQPNTVMALATTVYYQASWHDKFLRDFNEELTFNSPTGAVKTAFMSELRLSDDYYWGEKFGAVKKDLNGGTMWFILPDEGYTPTDLIRDNEALSFIISPESHSKTKKMEISFKTPKFDITSQLDLKSKLKSLGVTDVFDPSESDFSPMTEEVGALAINDAMHDARVVIDEDGCTASAYVTMMDGTGAPDSAEHIDFVLDRPFVFVVTSEMGLPLFVGIVNQPV